MFGLPNSQTADKAKLRRDMRVLRRKLQDETPEASRRAALRLPASRFSRSPVVAAYCVQGS